MRPPPKREHGRTSGKFKGWSGCREREAILRQFVRRNRSPVMLASVPALARAGAERLVDDRLDSACATAACCAAAKAAIDVLGIARKLIRRADGVANILVADDVAGTDDHGTRDSWRRGGSILDWTARGKRKNGFLKRFQS